MSKAAVEWLVHWWTDYREIVPICRGLDQHAEPAPVLARHLPVADPSYNHDLSLFRDDYDAV